MEVITDQLASLWLLSPLGVAIVLGMTALLLLGVPARIIDVVEAAGWRRHFAGAIERLRSARMSR